MFATTRIPECFVSPCLQQRRYGRRECQGRQAAVKRHPQAPVPLHPQAPVKRHPLPRHPLPRHPTAFPQPIRRITWRGERCCLVAHQSGRCFGSWAMPMQLILTFATAITSSSTVMDGRSRTIRGATSSTLSTTGTPWTGTDETATRTGAFSLPRGLSGGNHRRKMARAGEGGGPPGQET